MYEVEVKFRARHGTVRPRLGDATHEYDVRQVDTYYDHPSRDFADTDEALRVRRSVRDGETSVLVTYKGPLVDDSSKTREEHETAVADGDEIRAVLDGVGFAPAARVEKDREVWTADGYTVALDAVDGLGEFVEIEREREREYDEREREYDDIEAAREGAFAVARSLGLDPADQIRDSYLSLLLETAEPGETDSDPDPDLDPGPDPAGGE